MAAYGHRSFSHKELCTQHPRNHILIMPLSLADRCALLCSSSHPFDSEQEASWALFIYDGLIRLDGNNHVFGGSKVDETGEKGKSCSMISTTQVSRKAHASNRQFRVQGNKEAVKFEDVETNFSLWSRCLLTVAQ